MAAHRYWRFNVTSVTSATVQVSIALIKLKTSAAGANLSVPGNGTASASTQAAGAASSAFDNSTFDNWGSTWGAAFPQWVQWDFGVANSQTIEYLEVYNSGNVGLHPLTATLQYSDDGTSFTDLTSYAGSTTDNAMVSVTYTPPEIGTLSLTAPAATVTAFGGGHAALAPSPPTLQSASGAVSALTPNSPTLISTGHNSYGEQAAFLVAPSPTLTVTTGAHARATAPRPVLSASGTVTTWAKAALTAPSPTLSASGTVSGTASATLASPSPNLVGYGGAVCSITITGKATLTATGTTGSIGGAALSCPLFELTASATAQNHGSANLLAPSPRMGASAQAWLIAPSAQLTAIGSAVVTATYEAYAVNLGHRNPQATTNEVTRYTNFPFTHVVRYQNSYYGASSTGLYLLEGTTDDATPIPWSFKTGITDFDDAKQKTVAAAYFGGSMPPTTTVTLFEGDKVGVPYAQTTPRGADLQNYRETFARGVKGRYYALGLSGTGDIELDDLDFEIKQLTRRI